MENEEESESGFFPNIEVKANTTKRGLGAKPILESQIKAAQAAGDPDTGETYYIHWLATLESLTVQKGAVSRSQLEQVQAAWDHAAKATPHGQPVVLADSALAGVGF